MRTKRGERFKQAARAAYQHVQSTVERYGDEGEDILTDTDADETFRMMHKYFRRRNAPERFPGEKQLDLLKIMHLAAECWLKSAEESEPISAPYSGTVDDLLGFFNMKS